MRIKLISVGKANQGPFTDLCQEYIRRTKHYTSLDTVILSPVSFRQPQPDRVKLEEGRIIQAECKPGDYLILLDEGGKQLTSMAFSRWLSDKQLQSVKSLVFIIGGAYGFSPELMSSASFRLSLSDMTLPHQLARLVFLEQLYRAYSLIHGSSYHHE
jgi:23S rRNA (pseudouridine1915-N3)-methyltransferase